MDGVENRFERDWLTGRFCNAAKAAWSSSEVGGVEHETAEWVDEAEEEAEEDDEDEDLSSGECEGGRTSWELLVMLLVRESDGENGPLMCDEGGEGR